jgi:hypothetical protein
LAAEGKPLLRVLAAARIDDRLRNPGSRPTPGTLAARQGTAHIPPAVDHRVLATPKAE